MKSIIPIYKSETSLAEKISHNTISYCSEIYPVSEEDYQKPVFAELISVEAQSNNFDLFPINTILVTTGWNKNDDVFDREETWVARFTPEDKPFNIGHNPRQIIGHITSNMVVDDDLKVYDEFSELPSKFHILTAAVVYKHLRSGDSDLEKESASLIENIQGGNKFVSMEALFGNFDYGMVSTSGEQQVVKRCDSTSFLTSKLRSYGGDGIYNGCKIGRVLRNITFSGKGLVDKPANPESIILNDIKVFAGGFAELNSPAQGENNNSSIGEDLMADQNFEMQIKDLKDQLNDATARLKEMDEEKVNAKFEAKNTEIQSLKDKVEALEKNKKDLVDNLDEFKKSVEAKEKEKSDISKQLDDVKAELDTMKAEAKKTERVSVLVDKKVDKAKAEEIVEKYFDLDDEKFDGIVAMQVALVEAQSNQTQDSAEGEEEPLENQDQGGEDSAEGSDLEGSEEDEEPALGSDDGDDNDLLTSMASYFESELSKKDEE